MSQKADLLKRKLMLDISIFIVLMIMLGLSLYAIHIEPPSLRIALHVIAAVAMAMLVVIFFMRLDERSVLIRFLSTVGFVWVMIMIAITMSDYLTRAPNQITSAPQQWNERAIPLD